VGYIGFTQFYPWVKLTVLPSFTQFYPTGFTHWVKLPCQPCLQLATSLQHWPNDISYQITLTAATIQWGKSSLAVVTGLIKKHWFYSPGGTQVAIMIAIRSWRDVTIINHSNDPTSTALKWVPVWSKVFWSKLIDQQINRGLPARRARPPSWLTYRWCGPWWKHYNSSRRLPSSWL